MLHRLQATDHRFDARAHLLVLLQERGTLGHHRILPLAQGTVLLVQLRDRTEQLIEPTLQLLQFLLDADLRFGFAHAAWIMRRHPHAVKQRTPPGANITAMFQVTFPEVARVLQTLQSTVAAAESHGCLCGALCTTQQYTLESWLEELVPEADEDPADDRATLRLLFADTVRALRGEEMEFQLLLPDDDDSLLERALALSQWCQGFLYGFGTGRPVPNEELTGEVEEVLRDLTHISQASVETGADAEEEEEAYAEIVEYVRAGVQLIHDDLTEVRAAGVVQTPDPSRLN